MALGLDKELALNPAAHPLLKRSSPLQTRLLLGVELFGSNTAWLLIGLLAVQTYIYYTRTSRQDRPIFKALVYSLVFIAVSESAVEGYVSFSLLVPKQQITVSQVGLSFAFDVMQNMQVLFDAFPAIFVQSFFTWRIWTFSRAVFGRRLHLLVTVICGFIALTSACALVAAALWFAALLIASNTSITSLAGPTLLVWSVATAVADVTITVCMMTILYHAKANSYFGETRDMASRLLRLTVQTGFLTSLLAIPIGPLFFSRENAYILPCFLIGKSYVISLLANLNARSYRPTPAFAKGFIDGDEVPHLTTISFTPGQKPDTSSGNVTSTSGVRSMIRSFIHSRPTSESSSEIAPESDLEAQVHNGSHWPNHVKEEERSVWEN